MTTLISVFAVRFNAAEVYGDHESIPDEILALGSTVIQALKNRGITTTAIGMADNGDITLVFPRAVEAGFAMVVLGKVIEVLAGERGAWNEGRITGDFSSN